MQDKDKIKNTYCNQCGAKIRHTDAKSLIAHLRREKSKWGQFKAYEGDKKYTISVG